MPAGDRHRKPFGDISGARMGPVGTPARAATPVAAGGTGHSRRKNRTLWMQPCGCRHCVSTSAFTSIYAHCMDCKNALRRVPQTPRSALSRPRCARNARILVPVSELSWIPPTWNMPTVHKDGKAVHVHVALTYRPPQETSFPSRLVCRSFRSSPK